MLIGGGALLREKMVETASKQFIVIADDSKLSVSLGPKFPLPVEITPFCYEHTTRVIANLPSLKEAGCRPVLRKGNVSNNKHDGENIAITDNGNYILDLYFDKSLKDVSQVANELTNTVGVVEHGLFVNMAQVLIIGGKDGTIRVVGRVKGGERPYWGSKNELSSIFGKR
jgi:ribose 5-phosphate isomerase A